MSAVYCSNKRVVLVRILSAAMPASTAALGGLTTTFSNYHSEPFQADDVFFLDGLGKKRLYVIPSKSLVILRTGPNSSEWDDSKLPNLLIGALH